MDGFSLFGSREEAGDAIARILARMKLVNPVILALPRGGIPIGLICAKTINAPLDLLMVRKIGVPWQPELAAAAIVDGPAHELVMNEDVMKACGLTRDDLQPAIDRELAELARRRRTYLAGRKAVDLESRSVVIVDDGIATGVTLKAGLQAVKRRKPRSIIVAVPVAPSDAIQELEALVDRVVCLAQPEPFMAIGNQYVDFHPLTDEEVIKLLAQSPLRADVH
jgi:putative phosphoribosyl transferase